MQEIIEHGRVRRGWLGIEAQDLTPQLAESLGFDSTDGVLVAGVLKDGPADKAQIKPGDIVVTIDFKPVSNSRDSLNQIAGMEPETTITLGLIRQGKKLEIKAMVSERPKR